MFPRVITPEIRAQAAAYASLFASDKDAFTMYMSEDVTESMENGFLDNTAAHHLYSDVYQHVRVSKDPYWFLKPLNSTSYEEKSKYLAETECLLMTGFVPEPWLSEES